MILIPEHLRQDIAYKSGLPLAINQLPERVRNFNSGSLTACFPFYNSEVSHKNGVFCGINLYTSTEVLIDFYDRNLLNNSNITVIGQAGSGKTFFVSLLTLRSILQNIRTAIVDPEGEYKKLTKAVGGAHILIAADSPTKLNPFDIEIEELEGGKKELKVKDKVADLLNLIAVMVGGFTAEQRSVVAHVLTKTYYARGITEDPKSLYEKVEYFDAESGLLKHGDKKKKMPQLSDFHRLLGEYLEESGSPEIKKIYESLRIFVKGGVYDMFDNETSSDIENFKDAPIVTFDVSKLEESILRPLGMYISLSWIWEKFVKKNPNQRKRVLCDEAWVLVNKSMAGFEYTSMFLENAARRIRKRNGGLLVASQNFVEFLSSEQGKAVLTNAVVNIFLKQDSTDIDALQATFRLSDGEKNFLLQARRGEYLLRMNGESTAAYALPFDYEKELISKAFIDKEKSS